MFFLVLLYLSFLSLKFLKVFLIAILKNVSANIIIYFMSLFLLINYIPSNFYFHVIGGFISPLKNTGFFVWLNYSSIWV